jgi:(p)ppGpp synthase/HD superfamily hydrolase
MKIIEAISFASYLHRDQFRKVSKAPYISHPLIVSEFVRKYKESKKIEELVISAILHDVLEDTEGTKEEILEKFGPLVLSLVEELTSDPTQIEKMGKNNYLIHKMITMSSYAFLIKLCDRLSNILDNPKKEYLDDTLIMITEIKKRRSFISKTHFKIMDEILEVISLSD